MIIDFVIFALDEDDKKMLKKEIVGQGGFQSLMREILSQVDWSNNTLRMTGPQLDRVGQYVTSYGMGGFQGRLARILTAIAEVVYKQFQELRGTTSLDEFK